MQHETTVKLFVSSPGDTSLEREAVHEVAKELNGGIAARLRFHVLVDGWEGWPPSREFRKQTEAHLRDCDLFIMIFRRRYGQASTDPMIQSGTREEFELAQNVAARHHRPDILVYFLDIPAGDPGMEDPGPQLEKVLEFKEDLKDQLSYRTYSSPETFGAKLKTHLVEWLFDHWQMATGGQRRQTQLRHFFALRGNPAATTIVHPAREERDRENLLPFMYAEDFHGIKALGDGVRLAGGDVQTTCTAREFTQLDPPGNCAFVCVPSTPPGLSALHAVPARRFRVTTGHSKAERRIVWHHDTGVPQPIASPLNQYLDIQDQLMQPDHRTRIVLQRERVAVDFGVLARYHADDRGAGERSLVFLFGLRSLGTMGAAWYLDRRLAATASDIDPDRPAEILLRVAYSDGRIASVDDVSDEPAAYFEQELSTDYIKRQIYASASDLLREAIDASPSF